jgi:hypothetical protein
MNQPHRGLMVLVTTKETAGGTNRISNMCLTVAQ